MNSSPELVGIPWALMEKIMNYIATKPYLEAAPLINEAQQAMTAWMRDNPPSEPKE